MKKKLLFWLFSLLLVVGFIGADWYYNPQTGTIDYTIFARDAVVGNILYYDGNNWQVLARGANGEVFTLAAGIPSWVAAGAPGVHAATHAGGGGDAVDHDTLLNYVAGQHIAIPNTIATILSDWDADLDTYAAITPSANVQTLLQNASFALFLADLSGTAAAPFDWGGQNLTNVGSIAPTSIDCGGVITAASYIAIEDSNELRFYDNGNYVGFEAGALDADQIWVLPLVDGGAGHFLQTSGGGVLSWAAAAGGGTMTTAMHGGAGVGDADIVELDFLAADFVIAEGADTHIDISFDYPNSQKATTAQPGILTDTDWDTFNDKRAIAIFFDEGAENGAFTIDWTNGEFQQVTITGVALDITFTEPATPGRYLLMIIQGDGDDTLNWEHEVSPEWPGGVEPTLSTGNADVDFIGFFYDGGTTYYGLFNGDFF